MIARQEDAAALARREDRLLLINFAAGAAAIALALESWALGAGAAATTLGAAFIRPRRIAAPGPVEALVGVLGALGGLPLAMAEQSAAPGLALFLLVAQAVKLAAPRTPRDGSLSLVIGVVLAGVAASEGVTPIFGVLLLANAATALWLAAIRTRKRLVEAAARTRAAVLVPAPTVRRSGDATRRAATSAAGTARALVPIVVATAVAFAVFPRVGLHFLPSQKESRDRLSGFTDVVGLQDMGQIQQNDSVAFRAEVLSGPFPAVPYWRGRAMDLYDGQDWTWQTSRLFGFAGMRLEHEGPDGLVDQLVDVPQGAARTDVVLYQEPFGTRCLFTAGAMEALQFKTARPQVLDRDALGGVVCFRAPLVQIAYQMRVAVAEEVPRFRETALMRKRIREHCLRLPPAVDVELLARYARSALADRGVPRDAPPSVVVRALEDHLAVTYGYTLDARRTPGTEPVADFLFNLKKGHCEYFASALAVLLRTIGIPARLVSGFHGGEWSAWSRTWTVRQRNAHAWVEAETENGWVRLDPTPAREEATASAFAEAAAAVSDWLELRWYKWIIAYDAYDQRSIIRRLREAAEQLGAAVRARLEQVAPGVPIPPLALALVVGLAGVSAALALRAWRRRGRGAAGGLDLRGPEAALVRDLLATLARRGVERGPDETLREVVLRARERLGPGVDPLVAWLPAYHAARFGGRAVDAAASAGARRALEALREPAGASA